MLSNKWTFSLKILVVMLALAFVGHSAMAAEFAVTMSVGSGVDISSADNIQVESGAVTINVKFDKVVDADSTIVANPTDDEEKSGTKFAKDDLLIVAYNRFGGTIPAPAVTGPTAVTAADGKNFTIALETPGDGVTRVLVFLAKHKVEVADPRADLDAGVRTADGKNAEASIAIHYVAAEPDAPDNMPMVLSIRRASDPLLPVTAATENVIILLSEKPKAFTKDHVDVTNATWVDPVALEPMPEDANGPDNEPGQPPPETGPDNREDDVKEQYADNMPSTGRDMMVYPYVLTITPKYENKNDIVVKVKAFEDMVLPPNGPNMYMPRSQGEADYMEGMSKLTIKVGKEAPKAGTAGLPVTLVKELFIPSGGYLVVADDEAGSAIINPRRCERRSPSNPVT